jgi:hypothetical protein
VKEREREREREESLAHTRAQVPLLPAGVLWRGGLVKGTLFVAAVQCVHAPQVALPSRVVCEVRLHPELIKWTWWAHTGGGNAPAFKPTITI